MLHRNSAKEGGTILMNEQELTVYEQEIINVLDEIKELFLRKNRAYNKSKDPMTNFAVGGLLLYGNSGFAGRFEALKSYVTKHIANLYTHDIQDLGLEESTRDIATYMIIATVMKRTYDRAVAAELAKQQTETETTEEYIEPTVEEENIEENVY